MKMRSPYITFEGGEGSGKSTMISEAERYFKEKGKNVKLIREPGATKISEAIRSVLLDKEHFGILHPRTELLLYEAARTQLIEEIVKPCIDDGIVVISDRGYDSSTAYQGKARNLGEIVQTLNHFATQGLKTDLTIFLDVNPKVGLERTRKRTKNNYDRIEREKMEFHRLVRQGFLEIAKQEPERVKIADASLPIEEVKEQVISILNDFYNKFYNI